MTEVAAFADRLAGLGIEINLCGKRANRLWFWPEHKFKTLPTADREFERAHRTELKELVRAGLAPRLADVQASASPVVCPYCRRACVGQEHPAFRVLHYDDPTEVTKRDQQATAEMLQDRGAAEAICRLVSNWNRYRL